MVPHPCVAMIAAGMPGRADQGRPADKWLAGVCGMDLRCQNASDSFKCELLNSAGSTTEAIGIFAKNLHELLTGRRRQPAGHSSVSIQTGTIRSRCR